MAARRENGCGAVAHVLRAAFFELKMSAARFWPARRRARRFQPRLRRRASQRLRATREICLGAGARPCGSIFQPQKQSRAAPPHDRAMSTQAKALRISDACCHRSLGTPRSHPRGRPSRCSALERRQPIAFAERLRRDVVPCTLSDGRIRAASAARCRNRSPETRCAALSTKTCKRLPKRCCNSDARGLTLQARHKKR